VSVPVGCVLGLCLTESNSDVSTKLFLSDFFSVSLYFVTLDELRWVELG